MITNLIVQRNDFLVFFGKSHCWESSIDHSLVTQLAADDTRPEIESVDFDFPVEIVDSAMSHDGEEQVKTYCWNLLMVVDGGNTSNSFTSDNAFTFSSKNFHGVFLEEKFVL